MTQQKQRDPFLLVSYRRGWADLSPTRDKPLLRDSPPDAQGQ